MKGLKGKNIIVTGGGSGIGRAICARLAEAGVNVGVFDVNPAGAAETVKDIAGAGGKAQPFTADVGDYAACRKAVADFEAKVGPAHALVNNAGWDRAMPFLQSDPALWQKLVAINFYGPINMCHVVLPGMVERGAGGRIVSLASDAGRVGSSGESVYSGCKGGVIAFSKTLARENARHKITVNVVSPGPTDTPLFRHAMEGNPKLGEALVRAIPMRRLAAPADHAGMVAFLCSDESSFITGQVISVSGGLTMHG